MGTRWLELLPELLESISDRLPLHDYVRFRGVCRSWRSSPSGRTDITKFPKDELWLLFYDFDNNIKDDGEKCYLYTKSHPDYCTIRLPHLRGATVVCSKFGWLLAHKDGQFFFYHPLSFIKIDLLKHAITHDQVCVFTTIPTNPRCTIFIVSRLKESSSLEVSYCAVSDAKWTTLLVDVLVDVDMVEIGTKTVLVYFCCCRTPGCDCSEDNIICIYDEEMILGYNYEADSTLIPDVLTQSNQRHCKDWLRRFRKKDFMLDCCSVSATNRNLSMRGDYGLTKTTELIGNDDEKGEFSSVKAVWIDPISATEEMK